MIEKKPSIHFTVSALDQLSSSIRCSQEFSISGPLKSMDPGRAGAFAAAPDSPGLRNAVRLAIGSFRVSTQSAHPNIVFAYDNPSVRFGDRTRASSRPVSKDGATSFHFAHSYMSKASPIQKLIRELNGGRLHYNSEAGDHLEYIERDGAAEELGRRKRYDGLDGLLDNFEAIKEIIADRNAQQQQDFLERASAAEKLQLRNLADDEIDALERASFGTIGRTIEERHHFWIEVEKLERSPRGDNVKLGVGHDQKFWDLALANRKTAPEPLKTELEAKHRDPAPEVFVLNQVATPKAFAIYKWAIALDPRFPIEIEPGRGGRIQNRIIAELPHELDPHERLRVVRDFTNKLTEKGLPCWAVIHAPDENNDERNYHVHIVYYDRPAAKMADPKDPTRLVWDFEIVEQRRFENRHVRRVRPFLQDKDREVSDRGWVKSLRKSWEFVLNEGMRDAGLSKRYDARTYKEMGIELEPLKHIPSKTFNKERKGDLTPEGVSLARRQWDILLEKVVANNYRRTALRRRNIARNAERVERLLTRTNPGKPLASKQVQRMAKLADKYAIVIGIAELGQDVTRVIVDRVASRARLVFHAAFGSTDKKPRGRPRKVPLALPKPNKRLTSEAEEARQFLKTIIPEGVRIDRRNGSDLQEARQNLAAMSRRLEDFERNPTQNPNDRRQPNYFDLVRFDPSPEEIARRREEVIARMSESIMAVASQNLSEVLKKAVDEEYAPTPAAEAKPTEPKPTQAAPEAKPPQSEPVPAPAPVLEIAPSAPATGPGSRPAYLDDMKPKGTRYRYEPFAIRPNRPQRSEKPAPTSPVKVDAAPKHPPKFAPPLKVSQPTAPSQSSARAPGSSQAPQPLEVIPKPVVQNSLPKQEPNSAKSAPPASRVELREDTTKGQLPPKLTVSPASAAVSSQSSKPKPEPKGSFTIGAVPPRPTIIPGFVFSGEPVAFAREQSPADQAPSEDGTSAEKSLALSSIPEPQQPAISSISLPKVLFKRAKKGKKRSDSGPEM